MANVAVVSATQTADRAMDGLHAGAAVVAHVQAASVTSLRPDLPAPGATPKPATNLSSNRKTKTRRPLPPRPPTPPRARPVTAPSSAVHVVVGAVAVGVAAVATDRQLRVRHKTM